MSLRSTSTDCSRSSSRWRSSAASRKRCSAGSSRARCPARHTSATGTRRSPWASPRALRSDDMVATTYRGHGHVLARGADPTAVAAELMGRATGPQRRPRRVDEPDRLRPRHARLVRHHRRLDGRGHRRRRCPSAAPVASPLRRSATAAPTTATSSSASTSRPSSSCRCCSSARTTSTASTRLGSRSPRAPTSPPAPACSAFPPSAIDGMDVRTVYRHASDAVGACPRPVRGRSFLECRTYRFVGHSRCDPAIYRPARRARAVAAARPAQGRAPRRWPPPACRTPCSARPTARRARKGREAFETTPLAGARSRCRPMRHRRAHATLNFRDAIKQALHRGDRARPPRDAVRRGRRRAGGVFKVTEGIVDRFGPDRVLDTPISELALAGAGFGAAVTGSRPVIEIMFGDFMALAMDSLINQAAKWRCVSNGQTTVPLVVRSTVGAGGALRRRSTARSRRPGCRACRASRSSARPTPPTRTRCSRAAIRDDDPVVFMEHKRLYWWRASSAASRIQIGEAHVVRAGRRRDHRLGHEGRRTTRSRRPGRWLPTTGSGRGGRPARLRPLDVGEASLASLERTGRLVCVEEGPQHGWLGGGAGRPAGRGLDRVARRRLDRLDTRPSGAVQPAARGRRTARPGAHPRRRARTARPRLGSGPREVVDRPRPARTDRSPRARTPRATAGVP